MNRAQKYSPLTMSREQYRREHRALGSELFYRRPSAFREDIETTIAHPPETWRRAYEDAAGFYSFMWQNAAAFIDIAGAFTRRLHGATRVRALWAILVEAWHRRHEYEPMHQSARHWFRRVCMDVLRSSDHAFL